MWGTAGPYHLLTLRMIATNMEMNDHHQRSGPKQGDAFDDADHTHDRPTLVNVLARVKARAGRPVGGPCCSTFALRATTAPTKPAAAWHAVLTPPSCSILGPYVKTCEPSVDRLSG